RRHYQPGGECAPLVETGCVLLGNSYAATHKRRMQHVRMAQTGRRVLRRCAALRMDLTPEPEAIDRAIAGVGRAAISEHGLDRLLARLKAAEAERDEMEARAFASLSLVPDNTLIGDLQAAAAEMRTL